MRYTSLGTNCEETLSRDDISPQAIVLSPLSYGFRKRQYLIMSHPCPEAPKPNWLQKHLLLTTISLLRRFCDHKGSVLMLTKNICVKYGSLHDPMEAQTMMFIAQRTNIPVPKVYMSFKHKGLTYLVMQRIQGHALGRGWQQRTPESRAKLLASLKAHVAEMRELRAESPAICSVNGGSLYDPRMPKATIRYGPFDDVHDFHDYLRDGIQDHDNHTPDVRKLIRLHNEKWEGPTFTHGDLSSINILARGDEIVGIVDWETAGWYPSYWEYTTACQVNPRNYFWRDEIDKFIHPDPEALEMERLRQRYFGDF